MSVVPTHNVWTLRQQQNTRGASSSLTGSLKGNQNASKKSSGNTPGPVVDVADEEIWPQVNVNASKTKEKAIPKSVFSPSTTLNGIIPTSGSRKGDKTKTKWVPIALAASSEPSIASKNPQQALNSASNTVSHESPVSSSVPIPPSGDTSAPIDNPDIRNETEAEVTWSQPSLLEVPDSRSLSTPPSAPQLDPSSTFSAPPSRQIDSPRHNSVIFDYPVSSSEHPHSQSAYGPQTSLYPFNPYGPSSSHLVSYSQPPEPLSYYSSNLGYPFRPVGDPHPLSRTLFGNVEPSNERRVPPFGVGCLDRKGKRKVIEAHPEEVSRGRKRRRRPTFAVGSWKFGYGLDIIDLMLEESRSMADAISTGRIGARTFLWDGTHLVNIHRADLQYSNYVPGYPYSYYQPYHPPPYPMQFHPPTFQYPMYPHPFYYQTNPPALHLPPQPTSTYPPYTNTQAPQPTYPYPQPHFEANVDEIHENGIPIPNASTTTILISASPNHTESSSATSASSSTNSNTTRLKIPSSQGSVTATSVQGETESDPNHLPPLSALPTLNNLPTLGSIPTPAESERLKLPTDIPTPPRHSPPTYHLNPRHEPFIPSALHINQPPSSFVPSDQVREHFDIDEDSSAFRVKYPRRYDQGLSGWESGERTYVQNYGPPRDDESLLTYPIQRGRETRSRDEDLNFDGREHRGGYRPNGRNSDGWRGGRPSRRGFGGGRGRGGFRGRGNWHSGKVAPSAREPFESSMGMAQTAMSHHQYPSRQNRRGGGGGFFIPPNMEPYPFHHSPPVPPSFTPPQAFSTSPYGSYPTTTHPSPLISQGSLSHHHTPPAQYHVPVQLQIPTQTPPSTSAAQHPWPMPRTLLANIPVPLDEIRYRLLGQLEYYLSDENMVKDMWLRKKMSQDGWILLSVICTFNRITQLTNDLGLIKEVLGYSDYAEVAEDDDVEGAKVRMRDGAWKRYVLPPAAAVKMEAPGLSGENVSGASVGSSRLHHLNGDVQLPAPTETELTPTAPPESGSEEEEEVDSEEEDDIVFVMGSEADTEGAAREGWSRAPSGERKDI